jgi:hypothetical protein
MIQYSYCGHHVTERSSSLLDLVLVNNPHSILYSEVGPPLLDQTRYHMPTIGVLNHSIKSHSSYKRKVFMFDRGDFEFTLISGNTESFPITW